MKAGNGSVTRIDPAGNPQKSPPTIQRDNVRYHITRRFPPEANRTTDAGGEPAGAVEEYNVVLALLANGNAKSSKE